MEKPTHFHFSVILFKAFGEKHQMIIMAPDNIPFLVMLIYDISKHLVCFLVGSKLRLKTTRGRKPVFLWKPKVMKKRP